MPRSTDGSSSSSSSSSSGDDPPASASPGPDSPTKSSGDSSSNSDVVLVDLPGQDSRLLQPDPDSGVLVNIDGSTTQEISDATRDDAFVDAPDQLERSSSSLGESLAVIDFGERSTARSRSPEIPLNEAALECRRYKEESEVIGREVANLRNQLQSMVNRQSLQTLGNDGLLEHLRMQEQGDGEEYAVSSSATLHSMLGDCTESANHLRSILDELMNSEATIRELHAVLYTKDQEIDDLNVKVSESDVSRGVVISYMDSLREVWSEGFAEKVNKLEEENRELNEQLGSMRHNLASANDEASRNRTELEQVESKLAAAREKLSIAVTKGKSLVQHRDTLKQSLAERTSELESCRQELQQMSEELRSSNAIAERLESNLERCLVELQEKSDALAVAEASTEEMQRLLDEKNGELNRCLLELEQKTDAIEIAKVSADEFKKSLAEKSDILAAVEANIDELKKSLAEKSDALVAVEASFQEMHKSSAEKDSELDRCLLELDQKTDDLKVIKASAEELRKSLAEKTSELDKCLLESKNISEYLVTAKANADKLRESQNSVQSLQNLLSNRDKILQEIEEAMFQDDSAPELLSMDVIDRLKWFVNQKHVSDSIFLDNNKIRDALLAIDLPEDISFVDVESQIHWLGKLLAQAKTDFIKLQDEITRAHVAVALHESELSEAHEETDRLVASLLEEKRIKDSVQGELDDLLCKYEEMAKKLSKLLSQKDELTKLLVEVSEITFDTQTSADTGMMVDKCIGKIKERARTRFIEIENFDRMQGLLYVKNLDLMVLESILEEALGRASEEIVALKNERDSLKRELERVEDRSSQIRDRLSLAVRKGKGLMQERDGYKISLDEKNNEIKKLNQELELRDSQIAEYIQQVNSMSAHSEHFQKLELDILSLKDQRDEIERFLHERNTTLQKLLDSVESIPTTEHFEGSVEKVNWIAEYIRNSEVAGIHAQQELEKVKEEATLQASRLGDAFTAIKSLEDQLSEAKKEISVIGEEKKDMLLGKNFLEQDLEKLKEENCMQASKLSDAYTAIKSLEDALSSADTKISVLNAERTEAESRNKLEMDTLNARLAECTEELANNHVSDELISQIEHLQLLMKDENLLSLMTEEFMKKMKELRNMHLVIHNIHDQLVAKGLQIHSSEKFAMPLSLPQAEDITKSSIVCPEIVSGDLDALFTQIVQMFRAQASLLGDNFNHLSSYLDNHIAVTMQGLQAARDEFIQILEVSESLKENLYHLEAQNKAQEVRIISLQKDVMTLLSTCTEATKELQTEFHDSFELDSVSGMDSTGFSLESTSNEAIVSEVKQHEADETAKATENLLLVARRVRDQFRRLSNERRVWITSTDDLKNKLAKAELTAETAIRDKNLNQEMTSKLQGDLEALQKARNEMEVKIENYESKEDKLSDKDTEVLPLQHALSAKHRGLDDKLFSPDQVEALLEKINRIEIPPNQSEKQMQEVSLSSPFDKLFYILDRVTELQSSMDSLTCEKEGMQLSLESHARELEHLKRAAEITDIDYQDLESKNTELIELTVGLQKIIQRSGGNYSFEDQKPISAKGLLSILEGLTYTSTMETEKLKSTIQELAVKLQEKEKVEDVLSAKIKFLEDPVHAHLAQLDTVKEPISSTTATGSEISEIEDVGPLGKSSISPVSTAAHVRSLRKGSSEHLVLNVKSDSERLIDFKRDSDRLIRTLETDDKGHVFKSLNTSGLIPKQGKLVADRIDGIWVSGGRILMNRPGARLGLITYWLFLHLWLLGTIL